MSSSLYAKNERVLIIESDQIFGEKIRDALLKEGYDATLVKDGQEGLKKIYDTLPHLIMLDAALTGADGYEILEKKQAEPMLAKIPVFLLSTETVPINMNRIPEGSVAEIFMSLHAKPDEIVEKVNRQFGNTAPEGSPLFGAGNGEKKKLLWVEDDRLIGTILSKKLVSSGFDLFHAKNGEEAVEVLKSVIPDLIVLDLILPNMSGFDILREIKKDPALSRIPVMILSNLSKNSDIERAQALGAQKFLVKAAVSLDQIVQEARGLSN